MKEAIRAIRDTLDTLSEEFSRCAVRYPSLRHEQLHNIGAGDRETMFHLEQAMHEAMAAHPSDSEKQKEAWHQRIEELKQAGTLKAIGATGPPAGEEPATTTTDEWWAFAEANSHPTDCEWQEWHGPVEGRGYEWFGRFFGKMEGLEEFQHLAESLFLVLRKIDPLLPHDGGYEMSLDLIHEVASQYPTVLLRSKETIWKFPEQELLGLIDESVPLAGEAEILKSGADADGDSDDDIDFEPISEILDRSEQNEDGIPYFVHPTVETIQGNIFTAAAMFIKMVVDEGSALFVSDLPFLEPQYPVLGIDHRSPTIGVSESPGHDAASVTDADQVEEEDFVFCFDSKLKQWHIRFKHGDGPDATEDAWVPDSKGVKYIAFILQRPNVHIESTTIFPNQGKQVTIGLPSEGGEDDESKAMPHEHQKQCWERKLEAQKQITNYEEQIKEAHAAFEEGDPDAEATAIRLENERDAYKKWWNQTYDIFGRERQDVDSTSQKATNRVRNGIEGFKKNCRNETPKQRYRLHHFAAFLDKHVDLTGPHALYTEAKPKRWVIGFPK